MMNKKGFTLIEVMVALVIFAIVGLLAAQGLKTLTRSHDIIHVQSDRLEALQMAQFLIERNVTQTLDRPITDEQNVVRPALIGTQNSIEFTHGGNPNPQGLVLRSTLQRSAYFLNQGNLIQRDWFALDRTAKTPASDRILLKKITGLRFQFYDNQGQAHLTWLPGTNNPQEKISSTTPLPRAVEMTITLAQQGELSRVFMITGKPLNDES